MSFYLSLDLNRRDVFGEVRICQGDSKGTTIDADIRDDGALFDLTGCSARFMMKLPDGTHYFADAATVDVAKSQVHYTFGEEKAAAVAGVTQDAYFEISRGDDVIASTSRFTVRVLPSAKDGAQPGEDWDNAVDELIQAASGAAATIASAQAAATAATSAASAANTAAESTASAASAATSAAQAAQAAATAADSFVSAAQAAENIREQAETARATAETARAQAEATRAAEWAEIKASVQGSSYRVLTSSEYDPDTKVPTISNPAPNIIYLVPTGNSEGNAYDEWIYVSDSWEELGPAAPTPEGIPIADIEGLTDNDTSIIGTRYLNATGLNYLWGRIKAKFAKLVHTHAASDITSGTLPIDRGGTGAATAAAARTALGAASASDLSTLQDSVSRLPAIGEYSGPWSYITKLNLWYASGNLGITAFLSDGSQKVIRFDNS